MPFNDDFPVPLAVYAKTIAKTEHEVWLRFLALTHPNERHTEKRWHEIMISHRDETPLAPEPALSPQANLFENADAV